MRLRDLIRSISSARISGVGNSRRQDGAAALHYFQSAQREASIGRLGVAEQCLRNAIELDRSSPELHYNLGLLLHGVGEIGAAEVCYLKALELNPDFQAAHSSYLCLCDFSLEISKGEALRRHKDWARRHADTSLRKAQSHDNSRDPSRRLRLGYISSDFRDHVVGRFIGPVLENHDSNRFDIFCYSASPIADGTTGRLSGLVPNWQTVDSMSDLELAQRIRQDGIDILVDLSGHSAGNRLLALASKPAPVQLTWMGYLGTSGMSAMDYKCTDLIADPVGAEDYYQEDLMRLGNSQWCFDMGYVAGGDPSARFAAQAAHDGSIIRLGCMARFMKISDACLQTWIGALMSDPRFRLEIIDAPDHPRREWMQKEFQMAGLGDRVTFHRTLRSEQYWLKFASLDIALDPFPYNGATTTIDALAMGVPVVTLAGVCGASRSGASILSEVGMSELVSSSSEEYIDAIRRLSERIASGRLSRSDVRSAFSGGRPVDAVKFTQHWESQLAGIWRNWCFQPTNQAGSEVGGS